MKLSQRSYYYKEKETSSDNALESRIGDICLEFHGYGYRRVTKQLHREGWIVNHKKVYRTMADVQKRIPYFIDNVYNHKRLHSSLGYRPPCEFEAMLPLTKNPCQSTLITLL